MVGRARAAPAAAVGLALAASCASSSNEPPDARDTRDRNDDVTDAPTAPPDVDPCPGLDANGPCGQVTPERTAACMYVLPRTPPYPANIAFYAPAADAAVLKIPRDREERDGWDYVDAALVSIRLYGSWCDRDRSGTLGTLQELDPCSDLCIP